MEQSSTLSMSTRSESNSAQSESNLAQSESESAKEARGQLVVGIGTESERLGLTPLDGANTKYNITYTDNSKLKGKTLNVSYGSHLHFV